MYSMCTIHAHTHNRSNRRIKESGGETHTHTQREHSTFCYRMLWFMRMGVIFFSFFVIVVVTFKFKWLTVRLFVRSPEFDFSLSLSVSFLQWTMSTITLITLFNKQSNRRKGENKFQQLKSHQIKIDFYHFTVLLFFVLFCSVRVCVCGTVCGASIFGWLTVMCTSFILWFWTSSMCGIKISKIASLLLSSCVCVRVDFVFIRSRRRYSALFSYFILLQLSILGFFLLLLLLPPFLTLYRLFLAQNAKKNVTIVSFGLSKRFSFLSCFTQFWQMEISLFRYFVCCLVRICNLISFYSAH